MLAKRSSCLFRKLLYERAYFSSVQIMWFLLKLLRSRIDICPYIDWVYTIVPSSYQTIKYFFAYSIVYYTYIIQLVFYYLHSLRPPTYYLVMKKKFVSGQIVANKSYLINIFLRPKISWIALSPYLWTHILEIRSEYLPNFIYLCIYLRL